MRLVAGLNLALALALELAMLAAFGYVGYRFTDHAFMRWLLAILLPALTGFVWAMLLAPKAANRLPMVPGIALSLALFLLAALALYRTGFPGLSILMAVAACVRATLALALRQW